MNYEQKYKDALERAKRALKGGTITNTAIAYLQNIFPELIDSKDEKMIRIIEDAICTKEAQELVKTKYGLELTDLADWLEKQDEPKPQGKSALEAIKEEKVDNQNCVKPADEIGQKFKVGDIVQYITDSTDRRKIEEIDTLCNMYHTDSSPIMFEVEDEWKVVENTDMIEALRTEYEKGRADAIAETQAAWSEEDERMLNLIIAVFEVNHPNGYFKANELNDPNMKAVYTKEIVDWLKVLKQRITNKQ